MPRLKSIDSEIQITLQIVASRTETACALRWNTPRSSASKASTNTLKPTHIQIDPIGLYLSVGPHKQEVWSDAVAPRIFLFRPSGQLCCLLGRKMDELGEASAPQT